MPQPHEPRLEVDVAIVVDVGIAPLGIFVVGHMVLDDAHHVLRVQYVAFIKVARTAYFISYPILLATTVEELIVD